MPDLSQLTRKRTFAHMQAQASRDRFNSYGMLLWYLPILTMLTVLQSSAATDSTERLYDWHVMEFLHWMEQQRKHPINDLMMLDNHLELFFDAVMLEGGQAPFGEKVLAGLAHRMPRVSGTLGSKFPGAWRSLRGWRRLCPAGTRPPLPFEAMLLIAAHLATTHRISMGIAVLVGFFGYMRPRELTGLLACQVVEPMMIPTSAGLMKFWTIVLHGIEGLKASKTGNFDENLPMDAPWLSSWIAPFMSAMQTGRSSCRRLWSFSHEEFAAAYRQSVQKLRLTKLETSLYGLRHGGISYDTLHAKRDALDIKLRARVTCDKTLARYRKASIAQRELSKMTGAQLDVAAQLAANPGELFNQLEVCRRLLAPLVLPATSSSPA